MRINVLGSVSLCRENAAIAIAEFHIPRQLRPKAIITVSDTPAEAAVRTRVDVDRTFRSAGDFIDLDIDDPVLGIDSFSVDTLTSKPFAFVDDQQNQKNNQMVRVATIRHCTRSSASMPLSASSLGCVRG
jgi:hypothetical protein